MFPRWKKFASERRKIRRAARWWSNGLIARTFETWQLYIVTLRQTKKALALLQMGMTQKTFIAWKNYAAINKRRRVQSRDKSANFWATRSKRRALFVLHEFAVKRGIINKQLLRAMNWVQGNVITKMWFNWVRFVQEQKDFKRAVNMWRMRSAKMCYWAWVNYVHLKKEKKELKGVGDDMYVEIMKRRGMRKMKLLISDEYKLKMKVRVGRGEGGKWRSKTMRDHSKHPLSQRTASKDCCQIYAGEHRRKDDDVLERFCCHAKKSEEGRRTLPKRSAHAVL